VILDLSISDDRQRGETYFAKLVSDGSQIELKKIHKARTNQQNRYLHALFAFFGGHFGYSTDETKVIIKRALGCLYVKNGQMFLEHTSEMDTKKLTEFIDRFRNYSADQGCYLPTALEFDENYVKMMQRVAEIESLQAKYSY
jgi:hypothetical protein